MNRDVAHQASQRLAGDWSAPDFTRALSQEALAELLPRFEKLEPLIRVRLLLAAMHLPPAARAGMHAELQALSKAALGDKDEWVGTIARAVGAFEGRLDLDAVVAGSSAVRATLTDLRRRVGSGKTSEFRPLEEVYLSPRLQAASQAASAAQQGHSHFRLRKRSASSLAAAASTQPATAAEATENLASATVLASAPSPPSNGALAAQQLSPSAADAGSHAPGGRSGSGISDMFRPSRPVLTHRPVAAAANSAALLDKAERHGAHRLVKRAKMIDVGEAIALQQHGQPHGQAAEGTPAAATGPPMRRMGPPKAVDGGRGSAAAAAAVGGGRDREMVDDRERVNEQQEEELEDGEVPEEGEMLPDASQDVGGSQRAGWQPGSQPGYRDSRQHPYDSAEPGQMYGYGGRPVYPQQQLHHQNSELPYAGWRDHDAMPQHPFELTDRRGYE